MKTREQLDNEHNANVQNIRASHLDRKEISHEEYHNQLNAENDRHRAKLIDEGYLSPLSSPRDYGKELDDLKAELKEKGIL